MTHDRFGGRTKNNSAESGPAVRRNHNQIDLALTGHTHDLGCRISMHDNFFDIQTVELFTVRKLWQLTLGRVFQLLADVRDRHWLSQTGVSDRRDQRLRHPHANDWRFRHPRKRRRGWQAVFRSHAEMSWRNNSVQ